MTKKNTSWGGRFTQSVSAIASKFSNSIDVDSVLAEKDIIGSIAYAESLQEAGVINKLELNKIKRGLNQIKKEIDVLFFGALTEDRELFLNYITSKGINLKNANIGISLME